MILENYLNYLNEKWDEKTAAHMRKQKEFFKAYQSARTEEEKAKIHRKMADEANRIKDSQKSKANYQTYNHRPYYGHEKEFYEKYGKEWATQWGAEYQKKKIIESGILMAYFALHIAYQIYRHKFSVAAKYCEKKQNYWTKESCLQTFQQKTIQEQIQLLTEYMSKKCGKLKDNNQKKKCQDIIMEKIQKLHTKIARLKKLENLLKNKWISKKIHQKIGEQ